MTDSTRIRWGLLGTGNICSKLLAGARQAVDLDVVAVGSRTIERAREFARAQWDRSRPRQLRSAARR